jgi:hypothetical protein
MADKFTERLEPGVIRDGGSIGEAIAISLKRMADAVTNTGDVHGFVLDLAYQAGTNFEAGKRRA